MHDKLKLSLVSQAVPIMKHIVNKCMTGKMHFKISLSAVLFDLIKILVEIGNSQRVSETTLCVYLNLSYWRGTYETTPFSWHCVLENNCS